MDRSTAEYKMLLNVIRLLKNYATQKFQNTTKEQYFKLRFKLTLIVNARTLNTTNTNKNHTKHTMDKIF
jgi:hypothetical protein